MSIRCGPRAAWLVAAFCTTPATVCAHAFGERYDLLVPLGFFVVAATLTVALSLVVAAPFMRRLASQSTAVELTLHPGALLTAARVVLGLLSVVLLCLVVVAGFAGSRNPEANPAPVLVWIVWWVGMSFVAGCVGNIWPACDPWRILFDAVDAIARRLGCANGIALHWRYPAALGAWPAVFLLLLLFVWLEVIYPHSALPVQVAWLTLAWSALTLTGMLCFGREIWQRHADVFHVYFSMLGRFAPVAAAPARGELVLRMPGRGLITADRDSFAMAAFVIAMLATVLFDGLLGTQGMIMAMHAVSSWFPVPAGGQGYVLGTAGLLGVWLVFFGAYLFACVITSRLVPARTARELACLFAPTLVPIAIAYNVAHYFSYLAVHGQLLIPLLSDPLARGWDLLGTARYYPDIGLIDARTTWHLAIGAIVAGHVVSVWLAHRLALREFAARAVLASIPLTLLMVVYTAISLLVLAEPLVQFTNAAS